MPDNSREFTIRRGINVRMPFGSVGGVDVVRAQDGQPDRAKLYIALPGGEGEARYLPVGATFDLANGAWTVTGISGAGTEFWSVRLRRID
ncbi:MULTISPECIES: DUF6406 domain-containing protein [unclassified Streptomyces]|uniref:DUF6406 domain-containing protein n=1 Tax=unclassified Streptomyces TaxID=2593676 RepID=UPI0036658681